MCNLMRQWFYISTKGQAKLSYDLSSKAKYFELPHVFFSEITGLFELKFHMDICYGPLDQNGHHAFVWSNKIVLNNKPMLTLTYFNIIKEIRWALQVL